MNESIFLPPLIRLFGVDQSTFILLSKATQTTVPVIGKVSDRWKTFPNNLKVSLFFEWFWGVLEKGVKIPSLSDIYSGNAKTITFQTNN